MIGVGKIATDQHLPAIEANPRFKLAATVERSAPTSAINFTSHDALLAAADRLDAVAITTPPGPRMTSRVIASRPACTSCSKNRRRPRSQKSMIFANAHRRGTSACSPPGMRNITQRSPRPPNCLRADGSER